MRPNAFKSVLFQAGLAASALLLAGGASFAQQTVNLTAGPAIATLPDGNAVPMWGLFCGAAGNTSNATATAAFNTTTGVVTVTVTNGGTGYVSAPAVALAGGVPVGTPVVAATVGAGAVTAITVTGTYSAAPTGVTIAASPLASVAGASCTQTSGAPQAIPALGAVGKWQPPLIVVPYVATGTSLKINLTNNLSFVPVGATTANAIPTSLTIVGQLGGGLGNSRTTVASPQHSQLNVTWPTATTGALFVPPPQGPRVQSLATEVAAGTTASLTWNNLRPGTYLIESGTHPSIQGPMGLYGILVVTTAPTTTAAGVAYGAGTANPVNYSAEVALLLSEIDPVQNDAVDSAVRTVGFSETATVGTPIETVGIVTLASGGANYATAPTVQFVGGGGTGAAATAAIDTNPASPTYGRVTGLTLTSGGTGFTSAPVVTFTGGTATTCTINTTTCLTGTNTILMPAATATLGAAMGNSLAYCSGGAGACYPPAVNFTPLYYLINGVAFDKTHITSSLFPVRAGTSTAAVSGNVLVRLVNAGLRMHVPSLVGSQTTLVGGAGGASPGKVFGGFSIVAEDGNVAPGVPKVQSDVFMAAGKTFDLMVNGPAACVPVAPALTCTATTSTIPVFDRELSLSGNGTNRDAGMLAYIGVNGGSAPSVATTATAKANADTYNTLVAGLPFAVSDPAKGVMANDVNVYGVTLLARPTNGVVNLNVNGTFQYVPSANGISVAIVSGGSGYATAPAVSFTAPPAGGSAPVATATLGTSGVSITLGNGGAGYVVPTVVIGAPPPGGAQATATATVAFGVSRLTLVSGGSGYTAPTVTIDPPASGTRATATATLVSGVITGFTITNPGSGYNPTSPPNVTISDTGVPSLAAAATAVLSGPVSAIAVTYAGSGYTSAPTVTIADATAGASGATATAAVSAPAGTITAVNLSYVGSGYTIAPTVTFTGGGGAGASATATIHPVSATSDTFTYCANGTVTAGVCSSGLTATVTLGASSVAAGDSGVACSAPTFTSTMATYVIVKTPGILASCSDGARLALSVVPSSITGATGGLTVVADANGGFTAKAPGAGTYSFSFRVRNSLGGLSAATTATVVFPSASNLVVNVLDGYTKDPTKPISDYRWIIEEDRTFYINPNCVQNPPPAGCPTSGAGIVPTLGVNFHTSYMPFVAQGCTGPLSCEGGQTVLGAPAVCDVGNGLCRPDATGNGFTPVFPSQVHLDPTKRYYLSVLPGDAANPFALGCALPAGTVIPVGSPNAGQVCIGHGMGGAPIGIDPNTGVQQASVTVYSQPSPYPPSKLSVFVFEDDFPLNGEHDAGGGVDVVAPNEPGLGGFEIVLWDAMGGNGDFTGQMTHDMFNQPLSNALDGTVDPLTGQNACPISQQTLTVAGQATGQAGITGRIVTCPKYEADGHTLSPLAGQAVIANLMPMRMGVVATPAADRIARGEEWLQTNTLDGQKAHDAFARVAEPSYFQEFGPASYHVTIGFANPAIINSRLKSVCNGTNANITGANCTNTLNGIVTAQRLSRTPDERLYSSTTHDAFYWTQCFVSVGDPDGIDFAFTKCNADGTFTLSGLPDGDWRITTFDQWNDQLVDGLSTPVRLNHLVNNGVVNMEIAATQWQTNLYTRTFIDDNHDGIAQSTETGIPFANVAVRLRDGSLENLLVTDFTGTANFNETFPLFSWYTVETDVTRYKNTGTHVVYDAGGPADGTRQCGNSGAAGYPPCGNSAIGKYLANTVEQVSVPVGLRVPGAIYCAGADCTGKDMSGLVGSRTSDPPSVCTTTDAGATSCSTTLSTGRIDPPWVGVEGWQGFPGQNSFIEFGKAPYYPGENGGIRGHVVYASTRPFDDPTLLVQTQWESLVPHVTINLYREGFASDGVTPTLTLVDTTQTTSFDDWAQGFHLAADGVTMIPNMNCPGQGATADPTNVSHGAIPDLFFFSLYNQPQYLDLYNNVMHGTAAAATSLPYNSQFKCYDGMHNWNQVQPAPYDGMYQFPSVTATDPATGKPAVAWNPATKTFSAGTNCRICTPDPVPLSGDGADPLRHGLPILPAGKYVVEVVVPPGMELVKEEDKNILIGDNFIAPAVQEFGSLGNIFIVPDQASVAGTFSAGAALNTYNAQNPTQSLGTSPLNGIVPGFVPEPVWPCVGESRIVPDYISLYPQTKQVSPFAGAKRNLCDRKEVTLNDQMGAIAKFFIYTSAHVASKFTGGITDDYTSEFDPFSPQFGEKFAPPDLPVSVKDWTGTETNRVYADHWGAYNGMTYSTWEVNPPNPTGYSPTMMVFCMNDPGPILDTRPTIPNPAGAGTITNPTYGKLVTDPLFTQGYSQFCYELPFMPGTTQYLDTPVVPTSAFAGAGYNNVDCAEPDATPAISEVDSQDGLGPWVSAAGRSLTISALGDQMVPNYAYSGPSATAAPFNQKTVRRHYGFGAAQGTVTIGGMTAPVSSGGWTDASITVTVPAGIPDCDIQQQAGYGGPNGTTVLPAQCGELVVTAANGKQSIDAIMVTVGGKAPTHVAATASIQDAINLAQPGDMIVVDPAVPATATAPASPAAHNELLLMWKPVRLQGVGASASIVNANTHPAGKLDSWRATVDCLFGMSPNGTPVGFSAACGAGWTGFNPTANNPQVDRIPFESTIGWTASLSGNLAEQLQEPSLMGALEGAGITVLAKGVYFPSNPFDPALLAGFPAGTVLFTESNTGAYCNGAYPSNFHCNPSSIDAMGITNSSQGGGGILVHAWGHHLQIANNRIYNNAGTLSGGINLGQGEYPPGYMQGNATNSPPGSCERSGVSGVQLPYCHNVRVNIHNNYVSLNNSTGDELFSATPAGAGGVSICTGSDYYRFNYNWVCGNLSNGDGGGLGHLGFSKDGHIEHNSILFNQSTNPTIPTNGGGIVIMGTPDADPTCGATTDQDCVSPLGAIGPSDGVGPGLVINANLIMGNAAESGSGGGIAFQAVNGSDVVNFPGDPARWYGVSVTNNIIANNVAGWDGGGVSLLDSFKVRIVNNTIISNVTTASSGTLTNTLGAPLASTQNCPPGGTNAQGFCTVQVTSSTPQAAGIVSINDSAILLANLPASITCPAPFNAPGTSTTNGTCRSISYPQLLNNIVYDNSSFYIAVGALSAQFQQNVVSLYNAFTNTLAGSQTSTGQCLAADNYWDIGVRGDTGPTQHTSGFTLNPRWSVLSPSATGYNSNNLLENPQVQSQYCNGSRQPPEACTSAGCGWAVPPGISDATVPNPIFNLTPVATVDEGNNWINLRWGPLSLTNPTVLGGDGAFGGGPMLANYALQPSSAAINHVPMDDTDPPPPFDFFGNPRPDTANTAFFDVGAVEFQGTGTAVPPAAPTLTAIAPALGERGTSVNVTLTGTNLAGTSNVSVSGSPGSFAVSNVVEVNATTVTATITIAPTATIGPHTVSVTTLGVTSIVNVTFNVYAVAESVLLPSPFTTGIADRTAKTGTITVTNREPGPVTLNAVPTITLASGTGTWTVIAGGTCAGAVTLAAGGSCTVNARYTPPASASSCTVLPNCTSTAHVVLTGSGFLAAPENATPDITGN